MVIVQKPELTQHSPKVHLHQKQLC